MYIVISQDGELTRHDVVPTSRLVEEAVGPEGWARVGLQIAGVAAFVNDHGLLLDKYQRNPVGACVLAVLGAGQQPYAGPVVITGWDPDADGPEIAPLATCIAAAIAEMHQDVRKALAGGTAGIGEEWSRQCRQYAELVRTAPTPGWTILADEDAIAYLEARARATSDGVR